MSVDFSAELAIVLIFGVTILALLIVARRRI